MVTRNGLGLFLVSCLLSFGAGPVFPDDHGNTWDTATPVSVNHNFSGQTEVAGDFDYFSVFLNAGTAYSMTQFLPPFFGSLVLYGINGTTPVAGTPVMGGPQTFNYTPSASGTYYLRVTGPNSGSAGVYIVRIQDASGAGFSVGGLIPMEGFPYGDPGQAGTVVTFSRVSGPGALPGAVTSTQWGVFSEGGFAVGTTYRATPSRAGFWFSPSYLDFTGQDFNLVFYGYIEGSKFACSGSVILQGQTDASAVTLTFSRVSGSGTLPSAVTTGQDGLWIQSGFQQGTTYRVTPGKANWFFAPASQDFSGGGPLPSTFRGHTNSSVDSWNLY